MMIPCLWLRLNSPITTSTKRRWKRTGVHRIPHGRGGGHLELDAELLDDLERQAARYDLYARAAELSCPALFVHGDRDIAISAEAGRTIFEACTVPSSRFVTIERTGHTFGVRHPMERVPAAYEQLAAETLGFLDEHGRPTAMS